MKWSQNFVLDIIEVLYTVTNQLMKVHVGTFIVRPLVHLKCVVIAASFHVTCAPLGCDPLGPLLIPNVNRINNVISPVNPAHKEKMEVGLFHRVCRA